jgi:hypothetical protein
LNFDLCDLEHSVKKKPWVLRHVSLLDVPMVKFGADPSITSGVIALFVCLVLAPWWASQESDPAKIYFPKGVDLWVHVYKVSGQ